MSDNDGVSECMCVYVYLSGLNMRPHPTAEPPLLKLLHMWDICEVCSWNDIWYFPHPALITCS